MLSGEGPPRPRRQGDTRHIVAALRCVSLGEKTNPLFWFMMQIAMLAGFLTSYPVNWWLLRAGIKEKMWPD
ncbi:MAG TPA: DUF4396 domain-containing protein [Chthoniobacterales bacterium]|nr:DUF4396 domain-containing protein [Chthoniobacterales bacterium]